MEIPQAFLDTSLVEAAECCVDTSLDYHIVLISHPRTWERQMLMTTFIPDWSKDVCFYYPWDKIDAELIKMHVLWKFSADPNYILQFKVKCDLAAKDFENLNIRTWRFT
jgi:hypothetical protein